MSEDGCVFCHINRPEGNAIDLSCLYRFLHNLNQYRQEGSVLIIHGNDSCFSIGEDLEALSRMSGNEAEEYSLLFQEVLNCIESWPGPSIAHLNGFCIGAGLELALACDLLAAEDNLRCGMPGLLYSLFPSSGSLRRLAARSEPNLSKHLFLAGAILDRKAAHQHGLIHHCIDSTKDYDALIEMTRDYSPSAVKAIRDIRIQSYGHIKPIEQAQLFSAGFHSGETQKRLREVVDNGLHFNPHK